MIDTRYTGAGVIRCGLVMMLLWASPAAADPAFTSAPLAGALEGFVMQHHRDANQRILDKLDTLQWKLDALRNPGPHEVGTVGIGDGPAPDEALSKDEIGAGVRAGAKQIRACYQDERARNNAGATTRMTVRFEIGMDGSVTEVSLTSATAKKPQLEACLIAQIKKLKFPAKKGPSIVTYPFIFSQG
jgi:hypothetical protein